MALNTKKWVRDLAFGVDIPELADLLGVSSLEEANDLLQFVVRDDNVEGYVDTVDGEKVVAVFITNSTVSAIRSRYGYVPSYLLRRLSEFNDDLRKKREKRLGGLSEAKGGEILQNMAKNNKKEPSYGHKKVAGKHTSNRTASRAVRNTNSAGGKAQKENTMTANNNNNNTVSNNDIFNALNRIGARIDNLDTKVEANSMILQGGLGLLPQGFLEKVSANPEAAKAMLGKELLGVSPQKLKESLNKLSNSPDEAKVKKILESSMKEALKEFGEKGDDAKGALAKQLAEEFSVPTWKTIIHWTGVAMGILAGSVLLIEVIQSLRGENGLLVKRNWSQEDLTTMVEGNGGQVAWDEGLRA